jgi:diaminohydroxyphosphoribosylaminopyrimidine deaminase/5-amino-6-(5-phosphoribosylamino)uracil reductase
LITGSGTVLKDRPMLTDRSGLPRRRPLLRVILDRRGRVESFSNATIFRGELDELVPDLYSREVQSFMLECGPDLAFNAIRGGMIDKIVVIVAPRIIGGREVPAIGGEGIEKLANAIRLDRWAVEAVGPDMVITAYVHRNS